MLAKMLAKMLKEKGGGGQGRGGRVRLRQAAERPVTLPDVW